MSRHTPEPWVFEHGQDEIRAPWREHFKPIDGSLMGDYRGVVIASIESAHGGRKSRPFAISEAEANAQRIVDCVNACEGINPKAVPEMLDALRKAYDELSRQKHAKDQDVMSTLDVVCAAIAKAEGKQ